MGNLLMDKSNNSQNAFVIEAKIFEIIQNLLYLRCIYFLVRKST